MNIFRTDGNEVRREFYFAALQVHRVAKINDALVARVGYGQGEVDAAGDTLVSPRISELPAVEHSGTGSYLDPENPRVQRNYGEEQSQEKEACTRPQAHGRKDSMCGLSTEIRERAAHLESGAGCPGDQVGRYAVTRDEKPVVPSPKGDLVWWLFLSRH